jgi:hypothetical protein
MGDLTTTPAPTGDQSSTATHGLDAAPGDDGKSPLYSFDLVDVPLFGP